MITTFKTATYDEQTHHLTALAQTALDAWDIQPNALTLAAYTNNAVFRVEAGSETYALRVHRPGAKSRVWIESERSWLRTLAEHLRVPRPLASVYAGALAGYAGTVYCSLTTWLPGEPATLETLTPARLEAIGHVAGRLHQLAATFTPPPGFERPSLDWDGLFGPGGAYDPGEGMRYFSDEALALIDAVTARVQRTMDAQADQRHLIHADLIAKNILFDANEEIGLVDFDDCAFGYPLYDLTPIIWMARGSPEAAAIREGLWKGYTAVHPGADRAALEDYVAARHVASCRWVAGNAQHPAIRGRAEAIIAERLDDMRHYLDHGWL